MHCYGSLALSIILLLSLSMASAEQAQTQRSAALFEQLYPVLSHPRCTNCHTVDEILRAGDQQYPHLPPVPRGEDGFGDESLACTICHGYKNSPIAPGAVIWQAAPLDMGWYGLSASQLCQALTDRNKNG